MASEEVAPPSVPKRRKRHLDHESLYLENLPLAASYERSFMHRDVITHCHVTGTDFVVTCSCDGHVKFWKKSESGGIEFVKHFRAHLSAITATSCSVDGTLLCTASGGDRQLKIFDVINFDMINMIGLGDVVPNCVEWVRCAGAAMDLLAVADQATPTIRLYDGRGGGGEVIRTWTHVHTKPVVGMCFNPAYECCVSVDQNGIMEYWSCAQQSLDCQMPKCCQFESKLDTDLFEFARCKTLPTGMAISPDGQRLATIAQDRRVRIFNFLTGKLVLVLDETLPRFTELQHTQHQLPSMEFGRRMATERDLDKSEAIHSANIVFDQSGNFLMYATLLGVKLVNVITQKCVRIIGRNENLRLLNIALYQGSAKKSKAAITVEAEAATNPTLDSIRTDPTLICTAYKKSRFYLFSRREPDEEGADQQDRDVFNEKPSKEDSVTVTDGQLSNVTSAQQVQRICETAVIHTVMGDIHLTLYAKDTPRTVENFCVHARNGYYNGHIFHRVIKGFMVQTGDPTGSGTGGESIWGGEFDDEIRTNLRHDRPYTVSMANAGPNTNGSQFFVTVCPTPWLDDKHTVFGRVVRGMEVVQNISNVRTNRTDKPFEDVQIVSITVK